MSAAAQERLSNATGFGGEVSTYSLQLILSWRLDYGVRSGVEAQEAALEAQQVRLERTERAALDAAFEAYQRVRAGVAKSQAARAQLRAASRAFLQPWEPTWADDDLDCEYTYYGLLALGHLSL